jgi:hypothetical protein
MYTRFVTSALRFAPVAAAAVLGACLFGCGGSGDASPAPGPIDAAVPSMPVDGTAAPGDATPDATTCARPPCPDAFVLQRADATSAVPPDAGPILPDMQLRAFTDNCSDLYAQGVFPTFEIEIAPAEWAAIQAEFADPGGREAQGLSPKPYHPLVSFKYGNEVVTDAMIRLKGNPYFSWVPPKMQFVISFRENDRSGRFHGLRKISLDAPWYDPTLLRERIALAFLREANVPASCANNAKLVVNGSLYGVYVNKEHVDKEFLERNFDDPEGNLYKYGFELKTNEGEADTSRRDALWAAADLDTFGALIQRDRTLEAWAGEAMLPSYDGYWCCNHNYYIYDEPGKGFTWIPYDLDITFDGLPVVQGIPTQDIFSSAWGQQPQVAITLADPAWRQDFSRIVARMLPYYEADEFERRLDAWNTQIEGAVRQDPNLPFTLAERDAALVTLHDFFAQRFEHMSRLMQSETACDRGEEGEDLDRDGFGRCVDCDDLNREVHPGKPDTCNDRDDDCNGVKDDGEPCSRCTEAALDGARYLLCPSVVSWFDAYLGCAREGGVMAVPEGEGERAFLTEQIVLLRAMLQAGDPMAELSDSWWIGVNDGDVENRWVTQDQRVVASPPWAPGRPNGERDQNCAVLDAAAGGLWNDNDCTDPYPALCRLP